MDATEAIEKAKVENEALIMSYLFERGVDARPGTAVNELVVKTCAAVFATSEASFKSVLDNMDLRTAEDAYARTILSNYGLFESSGGPGEGYISLITDSSDDLVIRRTVMFTAGPYTLALSRDYVGTLNYDPENSSELYVPLRKYDEEHWFISIPASTTTDIETDILPGTPLKPSQGVTGLVRAETATVLTPVTTPKTLVDLKREVSEGVSAKIMAGEAQIRALLIESQELSVRDLSVVGMNDAEMLRDYDNLYGAGSGGRVDIYVKTTSYPSGKFVRKSGREISPGRFSVFIDKDDAPGFYNAVSVGLEGGDRAVDVSMFTYIFAVDETDPAFDSSFPLPRDARFSPYQNCEIEFDFSAATGMESPVFTLELNNMPNIKTVQDFVSSPEHKTPAVDYVVKAAVPVFLSMGVEVSYAPSSEMPDADTIVTAVAEAVNAVPMGQGFLSGAVVADAVNKLYPESVVKLPVVMDAFIFDNEGELVWCRSDDTLTIPELPARGVSRRTASFMLNPSDIEVAVKGDKL